MSIVTETLNRLQSARVQHSAHSRKPPGKSSEPNRQSTSSSPKSTGRTKKFWAITVLICLTLTAMGAAGYWWGRNFITGSTPVKKKTLLQESPALINSAVGLPTTSTGIVGEPEPPGMSSSGSTPGLETSLAKTIPAESNATLTPVATRSDQNPTHPVTAPLGSPQTGAIHETNKKSPGTLIPSPKTPAPDENLKDAPKNIRPPQTRPPQSGTSSSVSSHKQVKKKQLRPDAGIHQESTNPKIPSSGPLTGQGQRETSLVNEGQDPHQTLSETGKPKSFRTKDPKPTPKVVQTKPSHQNPKKMSPTYALTPKQRMTKAKFLIRKRQYKEALKVLDPLFESPPSEWEPWFWMGTAHLGLRSLDQAETFLMEGLVRDDKVPHLWVQRGLVYQQQGKIEKAIGAFREAELLAPDFPEVHLNLAHVFESQGNGPVALKYYRRYLTLTEKTLKSRTIRKKVLDRIVGLERP